MTGSIYDIDVTSIGGETFSMSRYRDRTLLIVNVASQCGYTPQYAGLEALYRKYKDRGLIVLGFPCNQFGSQEPDDEIAIGRFCSETYGVTFPLFRKIDVNGPNAHPLFTFLKAKKRGILGSGAIKWNFTKFLVDAAGTVVCRYGPAHTPEEIEAEIDELLPAQPAV